MSFLEAKKIRWRFYDNPSPSPEEEFEYVEVMTWLVEKYMNEIEKGNIANPYYAYELGGYYYGKKEYELALKYYEIAAASEACTEAYSGLGYIYYYGRTGKKDYEKAFYWYSKAMEEGDLQAEYKIADMYKNGYFVSQDRDKYVRMIKNLYLKTCEGQFRDAPYVEIYVRLAEIMIEEHNTSRAIRLLKRAKGMLTERIARNSFFGNLSIMKGIENHLLSLDAICSDDIDLYDLYAFLRKPGIARFFYFGDMQEAEAVEEDNQVVIRFNEKWFRTIDDFFEKAEIDGMFLTSLYYDLKDFEWQG